MGIGPIVSTVTLATAGTRVTLSTGAYAVSVYVEALSTNSGSIYLGDSTVTSTKYMTKLAAGSGFGASTDGQGRATSAAGGPELQLSSFYIDGTNSGDKVQVTYFARTGNL